MAKIDNLVIDESSPLNQEKNSQKIPSLTETSFNYVNSIIGSGILGMAYTLNKSGVVLGVFTLILVGILSDYSLVILLKAGNKAKANSYQGVMTASFGNLGFFITSIFQFVYPFLAMASYNVIIGDNVRALVIKVAGIHEDSVLARRENVIIVTTLLITLPISLYREIMRLSKTSFISLFIVVLVLFTIVLRYFTMDSIIGKTNLDVKFVDFDGFSKSFGIVSFAFMSHHNSFLIYESLGEEKTLSKWNQLTHCSVGFSVLLCMVYGLTGYMTFLDYTQGDLLTNYCWSDNLMNLSKLLFTLTIALTYPIECFVCREVIENIFLRSTEQMTGSKWFWHFVITITVVALTTVLSLATNCLGFVMALNGLLVAVPLAYIFPVLCYCKSEMSSDDFSEYKGYLKLLLPATVSLFGAFVLVNGLYLLFKEGSEACTPDSEMSYCSKF